MFCGKCGAELNEEAKFCSNCGAPIMVENRQEPMPNYYPNNDHVTSNQKSKLVAGLLQIFLGCFGVGRFYLGYTAIGVAQLLVVWLGIPFTCGLATIGGIIWTIVDGILILCDQVPNDANGVPLKE
ncbi:hypothetical protein CS063_08325 [Sporanaerobium hydrogeniformans]|uniref:Uncharacterized protein n=1 Tax=Sporanaerobium hydrogeniformans TaxID=3072179 RepID=A0AC61DBX6_9FIRM|nr:TM2 domain-containing protein [Sporanaerobium hydrogeniformans]PHV70764.1 hypothetical protein CS063_08325 [Sporanaerobium hydrogeniformans]